MGDILNALISGEGIDGIGFTHPLITQLSRTVASMQQEMLRIEEKYHQQQAATHQVNSDFFDTMAASGEARSLISATTRHAENRDILDNRRLDPESAVRIFSSHPVRRL
jgi:hypothetical protein